MNSMLSKRFKNLEHALMPEKEHAYLTYFDWQQTEQEAVDEWNAKHNTNFTIDDFDHVTVVTFGNSIDPDD